MSAPFPAKRPRPRPRAFQRTTSNSDAASGLTPAPATSAPLLAKVEPGLKREDSPGFEAVRAPPGSQRASSAASSAAGGDRNAAGPAQTARPALSRFDDDDDDDFFNRSRRRTTSQARIQKANGKARVDGSLAFLPEAAEINDMDPAELELGDEDDEGSEDDQDSTDSDTSAAEGTPKSAKRRRLKNGNDAGKKDKNASKMPEWTRTGRRKPKPTLLSSPAAAAVDDAITIDDSDLDDAGLPKDRKKGKGVKAEKEKEKPQASRLSLTPPPDEKKYNRSEWSAYITQAVHGTEAPQADEEEDPIFAQLRAQEDGFEISGVNLNPNLAKLLGSKGRARRQAQQPGADKEKGKGKEKAVDGGAGEQDAGGSGEGPSRSSRSAGASANPISLDDDSENEAAPRTSTRRPQQPKSAETAGDDSDDSIQLLPRGPPTDSRKRNGLGSSPARRPRSPTADEREVAAALGGGDGDDDGNDNDYGYGNGNSIGDVSVDLRPATPVAEKMWIKVQGKGNLLRFRMKLSATTKMSAILDVVTQRATKKKLLPGGAIVKLVFDGEVVGPEDSIESLDIEEDDQLEATW